MDEKEELRKILRAKVAEIIAGKLGIETSEIEPAVRLSQYGATARDLHEIATALEDRFGIAILFPVVRIGCLNEAVNFVLQAPSAPKHSKVLS